MVGTHRVGDRNVRTMGIKVDRGNRHQEGERRLKNPELRGDQETVGTRWRNFFRSSSFREAGL